MAWVINGNMTKKLLHKTLRSYLIFSILVLLVSAPVFYYTTQQLYIEETDESLILHKNEFLKYTLPGLRVNDIATWNRFNRNVTIDSVKHVTSDTFFYTTYYNEPDDEHEPYRELNSPISIQNRPYTYAAKINLIEAEDLTENIATLFLVIIVVLLCGLFIITKRLSLKLWKPFYNTLHEIEAFEIDKHKQPDFYAAGIEEFHRLNQSLERLIERNVAIFRDQREFVENAAHELQTPLAVFQAKVETLIQRDDITKAQSEILSSLNDTISRLNRLNKNLLLLSKIEHQDFGSKQSIALNLAIEKNLEFFREQATAKNITIKTEFNDPVKLFSNPVLVDILISNLFLNAIRHNHLNGNIVVLVTGSTMTFANTGKPSALRQEKLFKRFAKADPSESGNGLGLAIIKKITDMNAWTISYSFSNNLHCFSVVF
jgi:two-component system sensor histidine kinase ArlS